MSRLPKTLTWLIAALAGPGDAESLLADLECEFSERLVRDGTSAARRWVWREAARSAVPLARRRLSQAWSGLGGWPMAYRGLVIDLQLVLRRLFRAPGFTALAVGMLGVGIGATTAVFGLAYTIWLRPLPYLEPQRLAAVFAEQPATGFRAGSSGAEMADIRPRVPAFKDIAAYRYGLVRTTLDAEPVRLVEHAVSPNIFSVLGVSAALGRTCGPGDEGRPFAVISDELWRTRFHADPSVIGHTIAGDDQQLTIIGVMPRDFRFPLILEAQAWACSITSTGDRTFRQVQLVARLKPGATVEMADAQLAGVSEQLSRLLPASNGNWRLRAEPFAGAPSVAYRAAFTALLSMVGLFLVIACGNVASLLASRNLARRVELTVTAAIGASRWRLARGLLLESALIALLAAGVAVLITQQAFDLFAVWMPPGTPRLGNLRLNGAVLAFAVSAAALTAGLCALAPILSLRSLRVAETLSSVRAASPASHRGQHVLVVIEIALAATLLTGATAMLRSFNELIGRDRGYVPEGVTTMTVMLPFDQARYESAPIRVEAMDSILRTAGQLPGVTAVGGVTGFPGSAQGILGGGPVAVAGRPGPPVIAGVHAATPDYFRAIGVPVLQGRAFGPDDRAGRPRVAIVNETLARALWPDGRVLGQRFMPPAAGGVGEQTPVEAEVVGVIGDLDLGTQHRPRVFLPFAQVPSYWVDFVVRTSGDAAAMTARVRQAIRQATPEILVDNASPMQTIISNVYGLERSQSFLTALVATLGGLMALLGLYALLSQYVARRTREMGICLALGSSPGRLFWRVFQRGMALALAGTAAGVGGALGLTRALRGQVFGLQFGSGWLVVAVALGIALASALVIATSARRVIAIDPVTSIRQT